MAGNGGDVPHEGDTTVDEVLDRAGFDPEESALTRRQAAVLVRRERGESQAAIAEGLGTTRANVANVEARARENVSKARETVRFVETVRAPTRMTIDPGTDVYEVPEQVYAASDEAGVKVAYSAPEVVSHVLAAAGGAVEGRSVEKPLDVVVTADGELRISVDD